MLGDEERITAQLTIELTRQDEQIKSERPWPSGIIVSLIGSLYDGDVTRAERLGEARTLDKRLRLDFRRSPCRGVRPRRARLPESRRTSEKAISASVLAPVNRLLDLHRSYSGLKCPIRSSASRAW